MPDLHVTQVATVMVPVTDQDRALAFFVDALGFEKRADFEYADGERWVEVAPPGAASQVTLVQARDGRAAGIETGLSFNSTDVEADHAALRARGVDVDGAILGQDDPPVPWAGGVLAGIPPMFLVRDPDGNSFLIVATDED
ncbi:MAG TPA: VOC family protein [Solirubrobacteraceae bacterium]|jgi:catechol 2,3-dioxygenase-like lactoylglutathione lyase family enzyme|nr:VOC family protein [Solirubrobacteraceae bacterium]